MQTTTLEIDFDIASLVESISDVEPKNQRASVLKMLIIKNSLSERDTVFNGFRTRISELKKEPHNLNIRTIRVPFTNQFGRPGHYNKHFLLDADKPEAVKLFIEMNK